MASNNVEQDSCTTSDHPVTAATSTSLLTLPDAALAQISQHSRRINQGHPLLAASSICRDIVLNSIRSITLLGFQPFSMPDKSLATLDPAPWARLLHRACCQATPGLSVKLNMSSIHGSLPELLQPGIHRGGWSKVHSLEVTDASCGAHLIPRAFPALNSLTLTRVQLGDGPLFNQLANQPSPSLTSLQLLHCSINSTAVQHTAAALAQLPGLQALHLEEAGPQAPVKLAERCTGLTSLSIKTEQAVLGEQQVAVAAQNQGLRSLGLMSRQLSAQRLQPDLLQKVLSSCTALTQLTLTCGRVDDQGVLLTHGTSITDLTLGNTSLTTSKADWPCSWHKLKLRYATLQDLAYVPLRSVQELRVTRNGSPWALGQFDLPSRTPAAQLLRLLRQATTNLASCPAWVKAPPSELALVVRVSGLTAAQGLQLLRALAPVAGRHVTKLRLEAPMQLGQAEVEAIASSFAGSLTSLHLRSATLHDSFWKPLAQHFPNLQELLLEVGIKADVMSVAMYLAMVSCRQSASHQRLHADIGCFYESDATHLQACVAAWGLENIHLDVLKLDSVSEDEDGWPY